MSTKSPMSSKPTSPTQAHSPGALGKADPDSAEDPHAPQLLQSLLPCWATQALCDLARGETELRRLRIRHLAEIETVNRGVERAISGARREEHRLLERVEQDHRDAQLRLEQLQKENAAAARVSHALLEQRLRKLAVLREQIKRSGPGQEPSGPDQNLLLKGVAELLQPWEISLSLKKVTFKPSSQPAAVSFGDIRIQEHDLCLPVGGCGPQGQMCPLHSGEMQCGEVGHVGAEEERSTPDGAGAGQSLTSPTGRVVRKIRLSGRSDEESGEELTASPSKTQHWPPKYEPSDRESSQDDEMESPASEPLGEDLFLAVPTVLNNGDSESEELGHRMNSGSRNQRNPRTMVLISGRERSSSPERGRMEHSKQSKRWSVDTQGGDKGMRGQDLTRRIARQSYSPQISPKMSHREPLASQSCLDLTSRDRPRSRHSQSSDDHPLLTPCDSGRAPSPADSLDSCYTFIVSSPRDYTTRTSLNHDSRLSKSTADLTHKTRPLINSGRNEGIGGWRVNHSNQTSFSGATQTLSRGPRTSAAGRTVSCSGYRDSNVPYQVQRSATVGGPSRVVRSQSMSVIDGSCQVQHRGRGEPALVEMEEEGDSSALRLHAGGGHLVRQFGKQGSGRAELTLPSGVHATPQGQLFIVDCGNARVQVTDPRGNILQQVTSPSSDGSARRCRNYFDIAVNAKGLIALSCAAERALLVFSRHGRLLQTFGGSGVNSVKDHLEAPRGVTVTRFDEFLVADIRKGTLVALKLDPKTGSRLERTVVTGFHRPYLVAACPSSGMVVVSERGSETGREPCVKVLEPGWNTVRVLGVCSGMGPVLACPWGICIDGDGNVLVADWGEQHKVVLYPAQGVGRPIITQGLSSPRGLALLPDGYLVVSDSMHHCIKIYQYR